MKPLRGVMIIWIVTFQGNSFIWYSSWVVIPRCKTRLERQYLLLKDPPQNYIHCNFNIIWMDSTDRSDHQTLNFYLIKLYRPHVFSLMVWTIQRTGVDRRRVTDRRWGQRSTGGEDTKWELFSVWLQQVRVSGHSVTMALQGSLFPLNLHQSIFHWLPT